MIMNLQNANLLAAIIHYDKGDALRIQHLVKAGKYQEMEGPAEAEKLMQKVGGYTENQIERVKYLVGHHHTYTNIDGLDYQILVEADFLVNLDENASECDTAQSVYDKLFRTQAGKQMLTDIFL
jgi:hypothetical protein